MTINEMYQEAVKRDFEGLILLIEWLVYEKGVDMERDSENITYICNKYGNALNPHILNYKRKQEQRALPHE